MSKQLIQTLIYSLQRMSTVLVLRLKNNNNNKKKMDKILCHPSSSSQDTGDFIVGINA